MSEPISDSLPEAVATYPPRQVVRVRFAIPLLLLLATFCTTVLVGSRLQYNFNHNLDAFANGSELIPLFPVEWIWQAPRLLVAGIPFSLAVMGILLAHEMGHYLYCRHYRVRATLPFFIPAPTLIGTLGAFIRIGSYIESRAALFDIGIAGPIAGFVVAVPTMFAGLAISHTVPTSPDPDLQLGYPLIFHLANALLHPGAPGMAHLYLHPVALAGWAGMLATALNLLPGGQLDGGHIVFSVAPGVHRVVSWAMVAALVAMAWYFWVGWMVWAVLLALSGLQRPNVPAWPGIGVRRRWLAWAALAILVLSFTPAPVQNDTFPQVARMIKHGHR